VRQMTELGTDRKSLKGSARTSGIGAGPPGWTAWGQGPALPSDRGEQGCREEGRRQREGRSEEWRGGSTQHYAAIGPVARSRGTLARRTDATSRNSETCQTKDRCPEWDQEHRAHEAEHLLRR